jgi:hypothetical protein
MLRGTSRGRKRASGTLFAAFKASSDFTGIKSEKTKRDYLCYLRQGDLIRLTWLQYNGSELRLTQRKAGKRVVIPAAASRLPPVSLAVKAFAEGVAVDQSRARRAERSAMR